MESATSVQGGITEIFERDRELRQEGIRKLQAQALDVPRLEDTPITYPRWLSHATKDPVYVKSEEEAIPHYEKGYKPWPVTAPVSPMEAVKRKVVALEAEITALLATLSDEEAAQVMQDVYGEEAETPVEDAKVDAQTKSKKR